MATTAGPNSILSTVASLGFNITPTIFPTATIDPKDSEAIDIIPVAGKVVMGILLLVGVVFGIFGNVLVLFAILLNKMLRNQIHNLMILNLSVTDLLMSALPMPVLGVYFVFHWPEWKLGDAMCKATAYIVNVCGLVSVLTMVMIAIDRYFAVIRNKQFMKRRNVKIVLCLLWVVSAGALLFPISSGGVKKDRFKHGEWNICNRMSGKVIDDKSFKPSLMLKLSLGIFVIFALILMYARMGCSIWSLRKAPTKKSNAVKRTDNIKTRALKLMFSIVLSFLLCWMPYWIATFLRIFPISTDQYNVDPTFVLITYSLAMLNSSFNPALYALFSRKFRMAYRNVLERTRGRRSTFRSTEITDGQSDTRKKTISIDRGEVSEMIPLD